MCVDETHIRKLAVDAFEWQKLGLKLPGSAGEDSFNKKSDVSLKKLYLRAGGKNQHDNSEDQ